MLYTFVLCSMLCVLLWTRRGTASTYGIASTREPFLLLSRWLKDIVEWSTQMLLYTFVLCYIYMLYTFALCSIDVLWTRRTTCNLVLLQGTLSAIV
jgi:hypothetical protein